MVGKSSRIQDPFRTLLVVVYDVSFWSGSAAPPRVCGCEVVGQCPREKGDVGEVQREEGRTPNKKIHEHLIICLCYPLFECIQCTSSRNMTIKIDSAYDSTWSFQIEHIESPSQIYTFSSTFWLLRFGPQVVADPSMRSHPTVQRLCHELGANIFTSSDQAKSSPDTGGKMKGEYSKQHDQAIIMEHWFCLTIGIYIRRYWRFEAFEDQLISALPLLRATTVLKIQTWDALNVCAVFPRFPCSVMSMWNQPSCNGFSGQEVERQAASEWFDWDSFFCLLFAACLGYRAHFW